MFLSPIIPIGVTLLLFHHALFIRIFVETNLQTCWLKSFYVCSSHPILHNHVPAAKILTIFKALAGGDWWEACLFIACEWEKAGRGELIFSFSVANTYLYLQCKKKSYFHYTYISFSLSLLNCSCCIIKHRLHTKISVLVFYLYFNDMASEQSGKD